MPGYSFNSGNRQGTYGGGLGMPIQRFGQGNPYGPFAGMPGTSPGYNPNGGTSTGRGATSTPTGSSGSGADSTARQYLTGVVSGQNTPYNQTTRDNMYSQQSNMAAGAEAGRNQQIAEQSAIGGASPSDPSYQRLIRQSMAARQGQNQQSMGDIDRTANLANQQTQQQAAGTLLGSEDERHALQQGYNQRATQMAMGYLYGGGSGSSSGPNNFNLAQERQSQNNYDWAQNQAEREQELQWAREDNAWRMR